MVFKFAYFVELNKSYQLAKFHWPRLSGSNFTRAGGKHPSPDLQSPVLIGLKKCYPAFHLIFYTIILFMKVKDLHGQVMVENEIDNISAPKNDK